MLFAEIEKNQPSVSNEKISKCRPNMRRLKISDMPKQKSLAELKENLDQFLVFSRSIDLFYVFSATNVNIIQPIVQNVKHPIFIDLNLPRPP